MLNIYNLDVYALTPARSLNKAGSGVEWRREGEQNTVRHPNMLRILIWAAFLYFIFTNKDSESQQDQVTGQDHIR